MSIINRIRSATASQAAGAINSLVKANVPGAMGQVLSGAAARAIAQGPRALKDLVPNKAMAEDLVIGEVTKRIGEAGAAGRRRLEEQFRKQVEGKLPSSVPAPSAVDTPTAKPATPATAGQWAPAPLFGGLSLAQYRELFVATAMTEKEWRNLWHIAIEEVKTSPESPEGVGVLNLLALDVSFNAATMPGEAERIGSANLDNLSGTDRVDLRLTTLDDARGTIKRWFLGKSDQAARLDGTFGLPAEYLVVVTIRHMDVAATSTPSQRMHQRWLMRPAGMEVELSRRAPELTELQLSFTQFDTFMQAP